MLTSMFSKKKLYNLNLSEREVEVYWKLLHEGAQSVYKLSKELSIPRSTMYGVVNRMVQKGFAVWIEARRGKRKVKPTDPEILMKKIKEKEQKLKKGKEVVNSIKTYMEVLSSEPFTTNVKYYEGEKGLQQIIWNTLKCKSGKMYGYSSWERHRYLSKKFIELHQKEALKRGPKDHAIINDKKVTKKSIKAMFEYMKTYPLEIRHISSDDLNIYGDTYIYDNIFAVTVFKNGRIFGLEIENEDIVKVQKSLFDNMWNGARPIEDLDK